MDRKYIISEIQRTAKENAGVPLGKQKFEKLTSIKYSDWYGKYWSKWGDAVIEAGFKPNRLQGAYDENILIEHLISLIREKNKFPTLGQIRLKAHETQDFPSHSAFSSRLGHKQEMTQKVINYCKDRSGYEDIIEICQSIKKPVIKEDSPKSVRNDVKFGYVYLMKSGRYYKLGRSNCVEKRNYEIGIKLPEELKVIHKIKTDDPIGIEAYWHKRFEAKRKKGEWFSLSPSDVKAFKRMFFKGI